ncbi:hypothetical protein EI94DRAFT_1813265 [Lactarius quietus]|nr:hypothetical protein EI94DRAFT_1813265 [Lactarius quietus]
MIDTALCVDGAGLAEGAGFVQWNSKFQFFPSGATSFPLFFLVAPTDYHPTKVFFVEFDTENTTVFTILCVIPGGTSCMMEVMFFWEIPAISDLDFSARCQTVTPHVPKEPDIEKTAPVIEHLYTKVTDTVSAAQNNEELETAQPPPRRNERAYTTTSNIYDEKVVSKVYNHILDMEVKVTSRELLSLAPEIRSKMANATIRRRLTRTNAQAVLEGFSTPKLERSAKAHMPMTFSKALHEPPADAIIITDPYEAFLRSHPAGQEDEDIEVAAESNSLRAILPIVDNQEKIEAILDPGCQIIAMSEEVCNTLALPYDPNVRLNMVLANGRVNQLLGLAKNVPFLIGEITLYLQLPLCQKAQSLQEDIGTSLGFLSIEDLVKDQGELTITLDFDSDTNQTLIEACAPLVADTTQQDIAAAYISLCDADSSNFHSLFLALSDSAPAKDPVPPVSFSNAKLPLAIFAGKRYKPMALKIRLIETELPSQFRIIREIKGDPLENLPQLLT